MNPRSPTALNRHPLLASMARFDAARYNLGYYTQGRLMKFIRRGLSV
jgi:hypothetical protein